MKARILCLLGWLAALPALAQTKPTDLLLIGTFHFHNPGADVAKVKSFDILSPAAQAELEKMTGQLARLQPTKFFVEWPQNEQAELDQVYRQYLGGPAQYEAFVKATYQPRQYDFYLKNEIVQLAFRTGKKAGLTKMYALDYNKTDFPFDSVRKAMQEAHQDALRQAVDAAIKTMETSFNQRVATYSLTQLLLAENTPESLRNNKALYLHLLNRAGTVSNFAGAYLVSEWYRRNLYMYSVVQKTVTPADSNVLVLVGAGHAAMLREFVAYDSAFRLKALPDVLTR